MGYKSSTFIRPSYFIIGERKCGTSSLYRYLLHHPQVLPCKLKEPNFFGQHPEAYIEANIDQYFALFPPVASTEDLVFSWPELNKAGILYHEEVKVSRQPDQVYITGEASANTFAEVDPALLHRFLPDIKLVLMFRNPVDRAFSHHRMYQRFQEEGRDLGFKVNRFEEDLAIELEAISAGNQSHYLSPGLYLQQLEGWTDVYPRTQIKIFFAEELQDPVGAGKIMYELEDFLGLSHYDFADQLKQKFNVAPTQELATGARKTLEAFYKEPNQALSAYLNRELPW